MTMKRWFLAISAVCLVAGTAMAELRAEDAPALTAELATPAGPPVPAEPALLAEPPAPADLDPVSQAIADRLERDDALVVDGVVLDGAALADLRMVYDSRGFAPLWTGPADRAAALHQALGLADREGLVPQDYYPDTIDALLRRSDDESQIDAEILLTAAVMRYGADVRIGRLNPQRIDRDFDYQRRPIDRPAIATTAAAAPDIAAYLRSLAPGHDDYAALREALAFHRDLADAGGWPSVPAGPTLRPGESSDMVPGLRARLAVTGEYSGDVSDPGTAYDDGLVAAVELFQRRHGLTIDGIVGPRTLAALNTDIETRIGQIIATMERWRWLPESLGERYILVNVPGFELEVFAEGERVRAMDVIVGQATRRTPLFSSALTYLVFNPTWTVPTSIAARDYLPKLQNDPGYLSNNNMRLYSDWSAGAVEMSADTFDWYEVGRGIRNFMLRQDPGPGNALGKVKFMMPNNFSVYLHDTPQRHLFGRDRRAYSSGCVRVEEPIWLAEHLLQGSADWPGRRDRVMNSWRTAHINLPQAMPLHVAYITAWIGDRGMMNFREDIYDVDVDVLAALQRQREARLELALAE